MPGAVTRTNIEPTVKKRWTSRVSEDFLLLQLEYHTGRESFRDQKSRMEDGDDLYAGNLRQLFPDETAVPHISLVENKFKNALHDLSRLASSARGAPKSLPRGDTDQAVVEARLREAGFDTYWQAGGGRRLERKLYLDIIGTGMMALGAGYDDQTDPTGSVYPTYLRLDPRYSYPDVMNGELTSFVYSYTLKERIAAATWPQFKLNPKSDAELTFCQYHDKDESAECIIREGPKGQKATLYIVQAWEHEGLGVPVAFRMLDTGDGNVRGLLDQMGGPMLARNKIVRFMVDYLESISHSPIVEMGVQNKDEEPGPTTVYHLDDTVEKATMYRLPPAAPSGSVFNLLGYLDDQEQKEAIQPPARVGQVRQSIASGSFVASTQGQLTSVIEELQENMAFLREDLGTICARIDERYLDFDKPLVRAIGKRRTYTPSKLFGGWYQHEITYGAAAGLDKINAQQRVLGDLSARLISRQKAREQIDYLADSTSEQDQIDQENVADAILQRFAVDPMTPLSGLIETFTVMGQTGGTLIDALNKVLPAIQERELAAQQAAAGVPEGAPEGAPPVEGEPAQQLVPAPGLPSAPTQQVFVR